MTKNLARKRRVELPSEACPVCGTPMKEKRGKLSFPVNGDEIRVPDVTHLLCPRGHDPILRVDDARHLRERAIDLYRDKYGLLDRHDEIRSLRERLRRDSSRAGSLFGSDQAALSRWEARRKGTVQTAAMDVLLRAPRDVPGNGLEYLAQARRLAVPRHRRHANDHASAPKYPLTTPRIARTASVARQPCLRKRRRAANCWRLSAHR